MIPDSESGGGFGAMTDKNTQIMEPNSGEQHVVIEWFSLRETDRQLIESGLMAEFVGRLRVSPDELDKSRAVVKWCHSGKMPTVQSSIQTDFPAGRGDGKKAINRSRHEAPTLRGKKEMNFSTPG
jgi:hypothetical protein